MQCITVKQRGSPDVSTVDKLTEQGTANTNFESDGINALVSRSIQDRPANEDRIRGMAPDVPEDKPATNEPPFYFSRREYEQLYHASGVTDAHRLFIDQFFEQGLFVMEEAEPVTPIEEATA